MNTGTLKPTCFHGVFTVSLCDARQWGQSQRAHHPPASCQQTVPTREQHAALLSIIAKQKVLSAHTVLCRLHP